MLSGENVLHDVAVDVGEAEVAAVVAVGYRLTPENCRALLEDLAVQARARGEDRRAWLFGGTEPCVAVAREVGLFQMSFASGASRASVVAYLRGEQDQSAAGAPPPGRLVERIGWKAPSPGWGRAPATRTPTRTRWRWQRRWVC
jgi:hypothetical protein